MEKEIMPTQGVAPIGAEQIKKFTETLQKYKGDLKKTKDRITANENWWKLRNSQEEAKEGGAGKAHQGREKGNQGKEKGIHAQDSRYALSFLEYHQALLLGTFLKVPFPRGKTQNKGRLLRCRHNRYDVRRYLPCHKSRVEFLG